MAAKVNSAFAFASGSHLRSFGGVNQRENNQNESRIKSKGKSKTNSKNRQSLIKTNTMRVQLNLRQKSSIKPRLRRKSECSDNSSDNNISNDDTIFLPNSSVCFTASDHLEVTCTRRTSPSYHHLSEMMNLQMLAMTGEGTCRSSKGMQKTLPIDINSSRANRGWISATNKSLKSLIFILAVLLYLIIGLQAARNGQQTTAAKTDSSEIHKLILSQKAQTIQWPNQKTNADTRLADGHQSEPKVSSYSNHQMDNQKREDKSEKIQAKLTVDNTNRRRKAHVHQIDEMTLNVEPTNRYSNGVSTNRRMRRHLSSPAPVDTDGIENKSSVLAKLRATRPLLYGYLTSETKASDSLLDMTIGRLLDEAERLLQKPEHRKQQDPLTASSWLNRVSSHPNYAKLVQYFSSQRQAQSLRKTPGKDSPLTRGRFEHKNEIPAADSMIYGHVARYPHELQSFGAGPTTSRTLEKLRQLKNHQTMDSIESNKIDRLPEVDLWTKSSSKANPETSRDADLEAADSARGKFVYGNVILRPPTTTGEKSSDNSSGQQQENSIGALRRVGGDLMGQIGGALSLMNSPAQENKLRALESYGRVLLSPPKVSPSGRSSTQGDDLAVVEEQEEQKVKWPNNKLTLEKLRRQLNVDDQTGDSNEANRDELNAQQLASQVNLAPAQNADNEFEGIWHSGPLQEIEVRQIRSHADDTTSKEESKQLPQSERSPGGLSYLAERINGGEASASLEDSYGRSGFP